MKANVAGEPALTLNTSDGTILDQKPVSAFTFAVVTGSVIPVRTRYPDGSLLLDGMLSMSPLRPDLEVRLAINVTGAAFPDGGLSWIVPSAGFQEAGGGSWTATYPLIRSGKTTAGPCHVASVWHGNWKVGQ